jgi:murein DD-endopeptidase MepM/ murein hydrolase activator NlpD
MSSIEPSETYETDALHNFETFDEVCEMFNLTTEQQEALFDDEAVQWYTMNSPAGKLGIEGNELGEIRSTNPEIYLMEGEDKRMKVSKYNKSLGGKVYTVFVYRAGKQKLYDFELGMEVFKTFQPEYKEYGAAARWILRHEGMDFCGKAGAEVIAPASGEILGIQREDSNQGGFLLIKTNIKYSHPTWTEETSTLYVFMTHLTPKSNLQVGQKVTAGDVIAVLEPPGKPGIGARSHVHMQATPTPKVWVAQTDPNQFWQKGAGQVSCFNAKNPPTDQQLVAPLKCN